MYRMVFTQIFRRFLIAGILLTGLFLTSCTSFRTFPVEILEPASLSLEPGSRVGYWNRNICCSTDTFLFLYKQEGVTPADLSFMFYSGLNSAWTEIKDGDSLMAISGRNTVYIAQDTFPAPVPPEETQKIFDAFGLDYLVTLEMYTYDIVREEQSIYNKFYIRLYSRFADSPIDSVLYKDDLTYFLVEEGTPVDLIQEYAWQRGAEYARRLLPSWNETVRRVYNRQKVLRMGDVLFRDNQVEQAVSLWEVATQLAPRTAIQAYINLAWVDENEGKFGEARMKLEKALKIAEAHRLMNADVRFLKEYREILVRRSQDIQRIEEQL